MKESIRPEACYLGIELGSTRIKACLVDKSYTPAATGSFEWENQYENGYFTYALEDIHAGIKACYAALKEDVRARYGLDLTSHGAIGISGMMHGYLAFDANDHLLVPFRTWRNTTTEAAARELTALFGFNVPQRWSIAHLYQAILNGEEHVGRIAHITTLAGYIHYRLTGRWEVGIGEASGIFPVGSTDYDGGMLDAFDALIADRGYGWHIRDVLPSVRLCGDTGAALTEEGAHFLDPTGDLKGGVPLCPPEGDAGTGMVATNSVERRTGNVSAGTSVFSMLVLERPLTGVYPEIDVVSTPSGDPVAMVHSNNGCSELDLWVRMFGEFASLSGMQTDRSALYELLYTHAMTADADCAGVISYNYLAAEPVAGVEVGCPLYFREKNSSLTLASFFRSQLYAAIAVLRLGMDILTEREGVTAGHFNAHGGLFKVQGVAAQCLADALSTPVSVSSSAGEGGAWGMALLAAYMMRGDGAPLGSWLSDAVFSRVEKVTVTPNAKSEAAFSKYLSAYKAGLEAQRALA